ncbi:MAG TPA: hypothetical protein VFK13_10125 [Gemmatimonadaceae bacterium]|nr:hypothetical protein [Gemmatimonadaceae bacterium]
MERRDEHHPVDDRERAEREARARERGARDRLTSESDVERVDADELAERERGDRELGMNASPDDNVDDAVGGAVGLAGGAAIGALIGPLGVVLGAIAGAVGGWWAGRAAAEAAHDYSEHDDEYYRSLYGESEHRMADVEYDHVRAAYQLGHLARRNPAYAGRPFEDIEPDLQRGWTPDVEERYGPWERARRHALEAYTSRLHRESAVERAEAAPERARDRLASGRDGLRSDTTTGY